MIIIRTFLASLGAKKWGFLENQDRGSRIKDRGFIIFFAVIFFEKFMVSQAKRTVFLTVTDLYFINTIYPGTINSWWKR